MKCFWDEKFSRVCPERVDMTGRSRLKAIVADQMEINIVNNAKTHFFTRCRKYCIHLGVDRKDSHRVVPDAFHSRWEQVPEHLHKPLKCVFLKQLRRETCITFNDWAWGEILDLTQN